MGLELLLPVILFLITLVIIYLLRVEDKRDRHVDLMKQKVSLFSGKWNRARSQFKDTAQQVEERVNHKIEASQQMLMRLDNQLSELEVRSDDLAKLQGVLNTYRDSLTKLGSTPTQVEARIDRSRKKCRALKLFRPSLTDSTQNRDVQELVASHHGGWYRCNFNQPSSQAVVGQLVCKAQEYESEVQEVERANQARVASHSEMLKNHELLRGCPFPANLQNPPARGKSDQIIASNGHALEAPRAGFKT